jgi:hypothetical protein
MKINESSEQLLALLQAAIRDAPPLSYDQPRSETELRWLGRVDAILSAAGNYRASLDFRMSRGTIGTIIFDRNKLLQPLYDVASELELIVPGALQGAFIPPGDAWNGYAALVRLMQNECDTLLIVDPYITADIFSDFLPHAVARLGTRLLTSKIRQRHDALLASAQKWKETHAQSTHAVEIRYASEGALHDRLFIFNDNESWLISQSIKDIAKKSAASVTKADVELAQLKSQHYEAVWAESTPIS